ncbi:hypothetical protein [Pedobacter sp. SYSU D00535]|uniref:hypothetical protein n=1 Tax=Pedobacter sp. SYSU D00535 TaxID=2810308 RepID=UPI001A96639F|nr:hypothetical protein [Pedobacter sp. SYSU D00535]
MNLFSEAIESDQLLDFVLGKDKYYIPDREYGGHWPFGSYKKYIEDYLSQNEQVFEMRFWVKVCNILDDEIDVNLFLEGLIGYLISYYYSEDPEVIRKRAESTPDFLIKKISEAICARKTSLENDKRNTGAEWHSKNGMWGPIIDNLKLIAERGGANFITNCML